MISGSQVFIDIKKFDNIQIFECRLRFEMGQIQGGGTDYIIVQGKK